jgi:hypothetical protein
MTWDLLSSGFTRSPGDEQPRAGFAVAEADLGLYVIWRPLSRREQHQPLTCSSPASSAMNSAELIGSENMGKS